MVVIVCHKCSNSWDYTGEADRATCPECYVKVPVERTSLTDLRERVADLEEQIEWLEQLVEVNTIDISDVEEALMRRNYLNRDDLGYSKGRKDNN